jgi:tetratricopeptide (TPR) repeat protein
MSIMNSIASGLLIGISCVLPFTALGAPNEGPESIESYKRAILETADPRREALLRKKLGDAYIQQEEYTQAAEEFSRALSLAPSAFTTQDRVQMAVHLSWAGRLDEAVLVLRKVLVDEPKNRNARVQLAKILSWTDDLKAAEAEADAVLNKHPSDQEALIVKANVLRWRGDAKASIPVYEKALARGESFEARVGLAYAHLDMGEKDAAVAISKDLKPAYPYQERELERFSNALCGVRSSHLGIQYSYYKDSDDNRVNRYALLYGFWTGRWESELLYRLTDAVDPVRHEKAEDILVTTRGQLGSINTRAGAGIVRNRGGGGGIVVGQAGGDIVLGWGTAGVSASRDMLTDTAQLIDNRIVRTSGALSLTEILFPRITFFQNYRRSGYSDDNSSNDFSFGVRYAATTAAPAVAVGYRFRFWDFRRQSGSGYFDPEDFISHQVFLSLYAEKSGYYGYVEPYVGYQSFNRYDVQNHNTFAGFGATAGWQMKKCTAFEVNAEGSNEAGGAAAGFGYYLVGFRLVKNF